ncbi:ABC transporter ATP-binding protein [Pleomorphomonas diazotrophica]|uniref:ABC transporter ATP-binding protein n=1 Tax=Pleomorphomonas diazotrophica TaxID=1166257 RepID=A0A1I4WIH2_9HYPH|nr:sn-glycerol-3-phosphate ABC transporter ATP-binding protein UgpC [Pleomorphomonas diazotrophica]PKR89096.1 ABC transporter ATP-binding protein [Pleomorphomonas diazotrophica]SFN13237.1 multiple sugar transport system ATP-binding protein [Pleomorphomonas diazotrophica]
MAGLKLQDVRKNFGAVEVIKGVDLEVEHGEFVVFVGPSGCGKSTLLRMIAGLEETTSGRLEIGDRLVNDVEPRDRGVAMVFQSYALYPHMTVYDNVGFGLKLAGTPKAVRDAKIRAAARVLQMEHLLDRKPAQLSGGQRQRVAIGRAIVREPDVFLFDEPLSNLDAALRVDMRMELARLHTDLGATMVYVTHDQVEAMTLADKIVVLEGGIVQQVGSPLDLYNRPANLFVAGFIGSPKMNFLAVTVDSVTDDAIRLASPLLAAPAVAAPRSWMLPGDRLTLGIRPHALLLDDTGPIGGEVTLVERLGNETIVRIRLDAATEVTAALAGQRDVALGAAARLGLAPDDAHLFDNDGRRL